MQQIKFNTPTVYSEKFQKRVGSRAQVAHGTAKQTSGGLQPKDLLRNKRGEIVSKKKHVEGKKSYKRIQPWAQAYMEARDHLQIEGWQTPKKGTDLYMRTLEIYEKNKEHHPMDSKYHHCQYMGY